MKRFINNFRLLAGGAVFLAGLPASTHAQEAVILAPLQSDPITLGESYTIEVLITGLPETTPVSVVRLYEDDAFSGFINEDIADNFYSVEWTPQLEGLRPVRVEVELTNGTILDSNVVNYNVSEPSGNPSVSILAPASGSRYLPGTELPVQVVASAPNGLISRVEFFLNGIRVSTVNSAPFRTEIQLPSIGSYTLMATAYDNTGDTADSQEVILEAGPPDNEQPRVVIDFPLPLGGGDTVNDVSYASSMFLNATAFDPNGTIETVTFYINGQELGEAENNSGDVYSLFYSPNALGNYLISVEAVDNDGNSSWSVPLVLDVGPLERPLPQARILEPVSDFEIGEQVTLFAEADGGLISIDRVDFFVDGIFVGSADEAFAENTYSFNWRPTETGSFNIQARIVQIDPAGATYDNWKIVDPVTVTVIEEVQTTQPTVEIFAPFEGTTYPTGTLVPVQLAAHDPNGVIQQVEMFVNGTSVILYEWDSNNLTWAVSNPNPHPNVVPTSELPFRTNIQLPSAGTYQIQARVVSSTGEQAVSDPVNVSAKPLTTAPIINIVAPVNGSRYLPGTILPVQVQAYDPGGMIQQVEFLLNDVVVFTVNEAPFRADIQLPSVGDYILSARSTTTTGAQAISQEVLLTAGPPDEVTPRVVVDFPLPLGAGDTVNDVSYASAMFFNAKVTDPDGSSITGVEFFINGQYLGDYEHKVGDVYSLFYDPNAQGNYVVSVRATDADGNIGWSVPLLLDVGPLERPLPTAEMVQPFPQSILGRRVGLFVEADGGLIGIDRVDFFANGVFIGAVNEPVVDNLYSLNWVPEFAGDYAIQTRIVQIDPAEAFWDNWKISDAVSISIVEPPVGQQPEISIINPVDGSSSVVLRPIIVQASAMDPLGGIEEVRFYVNGKQQEPIDTTFPYGISYQPQSPGLFQFVAEMVTDRGLRVHSDPVTVQVGVTELPTGQLVSPSGANPTAGSDILLEVAASDPDGFVSSVEFFVNGFALGSGADTSEPFATFWNPGSAGVYDISALITDNSGNEVLITDSVTVVEPVGLSPRVTLSVTGSGNITPGSRVVVLANVFDDNPDGLSVTFFMNGSQLGATDTEAPFSVIVDPELGFINGYSITAVAADRDGNSRSDQLAPLYISDFTVDQPSIDIINIDEGENLTLGSRAPIRVQVRGGAARDVEFVVFYADGEEIGRALSAPYTFDWIPDRTGAIQLTAATLLKQETYDHDNDHNTPRIPVTPVNVASPVNVVVNEAVGILPSISLDILPARNNLTVGSKIILYADAQDLDGSVNKVEFFMDGVNIATDTSAPFTHVMTTSAQGDFSLNALATDSDGNVVTSTFVPLSVSSRVITRTPEISLTVPDSGQEGNPLSLRASTEGFVTGPEAVVFYVNGQPVGQSADLPYSYSWLANLEGTLTFFATAQQPLFDGTLVTTVSSVVESFLVDNLPPVIGDFRFTYPGQDPAEKPDPVAGDALNFSVTMSDTGPIRSVELLRDGDTVATSSNGASPFEIVDIPPGVGIYEYSVVVTDRGGLQTQSTTLIINVQEGTGDVVDPTLPEIRSFTSSVVGSSSLVRLPIRFTASATDEEGIERVELFQDGILVATVFSEPYEMEFIPQDPGSYTFRARVTNLQGNQVNSDPITINVRQPDPLNQNTDFVYQTFIDLILRSPTIEERNFYTNRIESSGLTRDRFIRELINPDDGQAESEYDAVRSVLLANRFLLDQWPTRAEVEQDTSTVRDGGLLALVASLMVEFEPLYAQATGAPGLPDVFASNAQVDAYVQYLFNRKYGVNPTAAQANLARLHFKAGGRDSFTASFISDVEVVATSSSYVTIGLGFQFSLNNPPDDSFLREADAASLLINLLRIIPANEEVTAMAQKLFATQVAEVLADPRYAARFATPFTQLRHASGGWKESSWFGWFNTTHEPWVYHAEQGWIFFSTKGQTPENFWYWDSSMGWTWTQASLFPVLYSNTENCWLYSPRIPYSVGEGRWFFNLDQNMWVQR